MKAWHILIIFILSISYASAITGGNITYDGEYTIHTFYTNGTFDINRTISEATILTIGGGGGGGAGNSGGGGGGAGGLLYNTSIPLPIGTYTVIIGAGGLDATSTSNDNTSRGAHGGASQLFNVTNSINFTAIGGGQGGGVQSFLNGVDGGSGGGGGHYAATGTPGAGVDGQGYAGGFGVGGASVYGSAGGGGAGGIGYNGTNLVGGAGGIGRNLSITGNWTYYAGGGGGGAYTGSAGAGGLGGGGAGGVLTGTNVGGTNGTGGGSGGTGNGVPKHIGGSGIVIIRYKTLEIPKITLNSISPLNNTYVTTTTPTFYGNITIIAGTWDISLILNGTSVGTRNGVSTTGIFNITSTPLVTNREYFWYFNATDTTNITNQNITDTKVFVITGAGAATNILNCLIVSNGCTISSRDGCWYKQ